MLILCARLAADTYFDAIFRNDLRIPTKVAVTYYLCLIAVAIIVWCIVTEKYGTCALLCEK